MRTVGYNDFNSLVTQTQRWLDSFILRNIHLIRFSFDWAVSAAFGFKVYRKYSMTLTNFFDKKNTIWVSKNAEFYADFESV
jgi:hypothetical protein